MTTQHEDADAPEDYWTLLDQRNEARRALADAQAVETALEREGRARRSNALEAGQLLAREALDALEDSSWDKAAAFSAAATAQFVFAMTPILENDFDIEV